MRIYTVQHTATKHKSRVHGMRQNMEIDHPQYRWVRTTYRNKTQVTYA